MKALLVAGGSIEDDFAKNWLRTRKPDLMIAADSGMEFFYRSHGTESNGGALCTPDIIVGDFDSVSQETVAYFKKIPGIRWEQLNPKKDDTDTEHALRMALECGADEVTILGGTGTRLDHVLGNLALLGIGLEHGVPVYLIDPYNRIRMIDRPITIRKEEQFGKYVSLVAYGNAVSGITLTGMKYPLHEYELSPFSSLGISNEIVEDEARIFLRTGVLIVVESRDTVF